ncbi:hypothetical protein FKM82_005359 [Ascaphus truei]
MALTTMAMLFQSVGFLLFFGLQTQAMEIREQPDFHIQKFLGKWYGVSVASNCSMFLSMKDKMKMPVILFTSGKGSDVNVNIGFMTPQGCLQRDLTYHTISPGHFSYSAKGESDVRMVDTDYDSYALEFSRTVRQKGEITITLKLYGRNPELPEDVQNKFSEHCKFLGFKEENIVMMSKGEECIPGTS